MSKSLWLIKEKEVEFVPPVNYIKELCEDLKKQTNGKVTAEVMRYTGKLPPYTKIIPNPYRGLDDVFDDEVKEVKVQDVLGDIGEPPDMHFVYEFYLASPSAPKYKFRMLFFSYFLNQYPIKLLLEDDIAADVRGYEEIKCNSDAEFKANMEVVITSEKVRSVVNALNNIVWEEEQ